MTDHEHVRSEQGRWRVPPARVGDWGIRRVANGSLQVIWTCAQCDYRSTPVPHHIAGNYVFIADLPIVEDHAGHYARCIVKGCDSDEVEWNHIAPRGIFGDEEAERWGLVALCRRHHQEWGERVTPQLNPSRHRGAA